VNVIREFSGRYSTYEIHEQSINDDSIKTLHNLGSSLGLYRWKSTGKFYRVDASSVGGKGRGTCTIRTVGHAETSYSVLALLLTQRPLISILIKCATAVTSP
jgi:hypothetical protein